MDEWRHEKEGNEWAQEPIGHQSKTKMARSTVPQGIMVTRMDTNLFSSCYHLLLRMDYIGKSQKYLLTFCMGSTPRTQDDENASKCCK